MHFLSPKTSSKPQPFIHIGIDKPKNYTIAELVSFPKQILFEKRKTMKESSSMEMGKIKKELVSVSIQVNNGKMEKSKASSNQQEESDEWKEQILRLISERETRAEERYKKLLEDAKVREATDMARLAELQSRIMYLEHEVRAAEVKVELYNTRFEELRSRVSSMEEDTQVLMNEWKLNSTRLEEEFGAAANANDEVMVDQNGGDVDQEIHSSQVDGPSNSVMNIGKKLASESVRLLDSRMVSTMQSNGGHGPGDVVVIDDSDDEPMEDNLSVSANKRKRAVPSESCVGDDSSSDSEDGARNRSTNWENESDLILALTKCPELCMRAVCALYREKYFDLVLPNTRNTDKAEALRGTKLAEFLTDMNPQATLKKSIPELQKHDPRGLEDCKRLAIRYSQKLFDIYTKFEDPCFLRY